MIKTLEFLFSVINRREFKVDYGVIKMWDDLLSEFHWNKNLETGDMNKIVGGEKSLASVLYDLIMRIESGEGIELIKYHRDQLKFDFGVEE